MSEKESGNTGAAESCLFCAIQTDDRKRIVEENDYAYAIRDGFPVTPGHTLFIPKRHVPDYFGLTQEERDAINLLIHSQKKILETEDPTIEGWNIGINNGFVRSDGLPLPRAPDSAPEGRRGESAGRRPARHSVQRLLLKSTSGRISVGFFGQPISCQSVFMSEFRKLLFAAPRVNRTVLRGRRVKSFKLFGKKAG